MWAPASARLGCIDHRPPALRVKNRHGADRVCRVWKTGQRIWAEFKTLPSISPVDKDANPASGRREKKKGKEKWLESQDDTL